MKGGAQQEKKPYPEAPLPSGAGYIRTPPAPAGRGEVAAHQCSPGTSVVQQGGTVPLEIVGVKGDEHPSTIPGLVASFPGKRGQSTRVRFTASRPGLYPILRTEHPPNRQGPLAVLPKARAPQGGPLDDPED